MKMRLAGFSLIELMVVIAIVGILASIALPAYQNYSVRAKISEAIVAVGPAKEMLSEAFTEGGIGAMDQAAIDYNATPQVQKISKYVAGISVLGSSTPWPIEVIISATADNGMPSSIDGTTIIFSPYIQSAVPSSTSIGAIDWACASSTAQNAIGRGFLNVQLGTLPSRYAPSECR